MSKKIFTRKVFFFLLISFFLLNFSIYASTGGKIRVLLSVAKANYSKVENLVKSLNGTVNFKHKYCDGLAVSIPKEALTQLSQTQEIKQVLKDLSIKRPKPVQMSKPNYSNLPLYGEAVFSNSEAITGEELRLKLATGPYKADTEPYNYFPFTNDLTKANEFIVNTGHLGENVIVGVIDDGVSSAATAVSNRIVGAENFTGDGIPGDSPLNGTHGTWVACCIGANSIFGFTNPAIQNAVGLYAPNSILPDYFGSGIDGIPMVPRFHFTH